MWAELIWNEDRLWSNINPPTQTSSLCTASVINRTFRQINPLGANYMLCLPWIILLISLYCSVSFTPCLVLSLRSVVTALMLSGSGPESLTRETRLFSYNSKAGLRWRNGARGSKGSLGFRDGPRLRKTMEPLFQSSRFARWIWHLRSDMPDGILMSGLREQGWVECDCEVGKGFSLTTLRQIALGSEAWGIAERTFRGNTELGDPEGLDGFQVWVSLRKETERVSCFKMAIIGFCQLNICTLRTLCVLSGCITFPWKLR